MTAPGHFEYVVLLDTSGQPYKATGTGGTSMSDDAAFTAASSSFTPVGGIVTADSVDSGDGGAFAMLANRQQKITLYDSSGVEITSFGGGTQYTDGAAPPGSPVGPTLLWNDGGTWRHVSAANPLPTSATVDTTGLATSAKQDTIIGHIDGVEGLLSTIASQQLADGHNVTVDDVDVTSQVATGFDHGANRDVDTSAEQLTASSIAAKFGVLVRAAPGNSGVVYVGNSDVTAGTDGTTDGMPLQAGESVLVKVNNANLIYVIGSANNQIVYFMAV